MQLNTVPIHLFTKQVLQNCDHTIGNNCWWEKHCPRPQGARWKAFGSIPLEKQAMETYNFQSPIFSNVLLQWPLTVGPHLEPLNLPSMHGLPAMFGLWTWRAGVLSPCIVPACNLDSGMIHSPSPHIPWPTWNRHGHYRSDGEGRARLPLNVSEKSNQKQFNHHGGFHPWCQQLEKERPKMRNFNAWKCKSQKYK